jgi:hypothetical protein
MTADMTDPDAAILVEHLKVEEPSASRIQIDAEGNLIISEAEHLATLSGTASVASGNKAVRKLEVSQPEGVFHWQHKL